MATHKLSVPKNERVWATYYNNGQEQPSYIITSKENRDYYFLYSVAKDASLTKLGKAKTPPELEEKYMKRFLKTK